RERDHRIGAARGGPPGRHPIFQARPVPSRTGLGGPVVGVKDATVKDFLAAVAAPAPTPGGGSVSALAGALSAALSRMVAGLARGKAGYDGVESELAQIEDRGKVIQGRLEALIDEHARADEIGHEAMAVVTERL